MSETQIATVDNGEVEQQTAMTLAGVKRQVNLIQQVMRSEMAKGEHYGVIPGCGDKPALLKAGAEKLNLTFRMAPKFDISITPLGSGHREYSIKTSLYHIDSGKFLGEGLGSCSTMESKYRYRDDKRKCPACKSDAIIKGKEEYGGGWICYAKKGGCGKKFADDDKGIVDQKVGKIENPDIADVYNTVLKMAKKRSHVDATLSATAASDIFTQDIEEMAEPEVAIKKPEAAKTMEGIRASIDPNAQLTPGQINTLHAKLTEMMAEEDEVIQFIKDRFGKSETKNLTFSEAQIVLKTWKEGEEPPKEAQVVTPKAKAK